MLEFNDIEPIFANDGYRPNVGIVLFNKHGKVFWARRARHDGWQFPQGGMRRDETPLQAMYRELWEETGLRRDQVRIIAHTSDWLRYDLPKRLLRQFQPPAGETSGDCDQPRFRGQKQIWFLLEFLREDSAVRLDRASKPEFDHWVWKDYWQVLDEIVDFKRNVYSQALRELSRYLPKISDISDR